MSCWYHANLFEEKKDLCRTVPLLLHGDGVEYVGTDSLEVLSIGPLLATGDSLDVLYAFALWPYSCTVKSKTGQSTWQEPWKVFLWSFRALMSGKHPTVDYNGKPFQPKTKQAELAGTYLTNEKLKFVIWSISGDHEHHSNYFKLPHWAATKWCWDCSVKKGSGLSFGMHGPEPDCEKRTLESVHMPFFSWKA